MADENPGASQQLQSSLFQELVLQEAIKDKTAMVEAEMAAQQQAKENYDAQNAQDEEEKAGSDLSDDFGGDDEESERIMRSMREQRIQAMKAEYEEKQTNRTLGHGTYTEIVEAEFLPLVTKTKYVVVAFFHQDF